MRERSILDSFFQPETPLDVARAQRALAAASSGEIKSGEGLHAWGRPVPGGLFCPRVFGPTEDNRCACGFIRGEVERRGMRCEKCGVEAIESAVRELRWGHLRAAATLLHPALIPVLERITGVGAHELRLLCSFAAHLEEGRVVVNGEPPESTFVDDRVVVPTVPEPHGAQAILELARQAKPDPELAAAGLELVDLLVGAVPVIPPGDRPLVPLPNPTGDRWLELAGGSEWGAENRAYAALIARNHRLQRLIELNAPEILLQEDALATQAAFERLCGLLARPVGDPVRGAVPTTAWSAPDEESRAEGDEGEPIDPCALAGAPLVSDPKQRRVHHDAPLDPRRARACGWVDDERLLVQLAYAMFVVDVRTGALSRPWPSTDHRMLGTSGRRGIFVDLYTRWHDPEERALRGVALFDTDTGEWLRRVPDDVGLIFVEKDQPEDAWLQNWRTGQTAPAAEDRSGDRPQEMARTPDHRYLWISSASDDGAVVDVKTGRCQLKISTMELSHQESPVLARPGAKTPSRGEPDVEVEHVAIARAGERWSILDGSGRVSRDGQVLFRLGWSVTAAAFDPSGDRLAVIDDSAIRVIALPEGGDARVIAELDLDPLRDSLGAGPGRGLSRMRLDALLVRYGTLAAACAESDVTLKCVPEIGAATLRKLRAGAVAPFPERLPARR